eukprot:COSAG01_NODE_666_length_14393_cov_8.519029_4_plen_192_part_00
MLPLYRIRGRPSASDGTAMDIGTSGMLLRLSDITALKASVDMTPANPPIDRKPSASPRRLDPGPWSAPDTFPGFFLAIKAEVIPAVTTHAVGYATTVAATSPKPSDIAPPPPQPAAAGLHTSASTCKRALAQADDHISSAAKKVQIKNVGRKLSDPRSGRSAIPGAGVATNNVAGIMAAGGAAAGASLTVA